MFLKPGCEEEYERRHAAIWPELKQMIKDQGVSDYSIFWDKETNILFAVQKCNKETNSQDTENVDPITQRWWNMMVEHDGRYNGGQSRQLACQHPTQRAVPHGLM